MKLPLMLLGPLLLLTACTITPPQQTRISRNGSMYSKLDPEHRRLVASGRVVEGMSKDAVYLAWGTPDQIFQGQNDGVTRERWIYTRSRPVHTTSFGLGYGHYPRYSRWGYRGCVYHGFPDTVYVAERVATVEFVNEVVDSWERKN